MFAAVFSVFRGRMGGPNLQMAIAGWKMLEARHSLAKVCASR